MHNGNGLFTKFVRSRLPKGQFARGVTLLAGGNALAQLIMLMASPVLTRLYTPENFGLLALYMSITGILKVILSLRYELAINIAESMYEAIALLKLCLIIVLLFTLLTILLVIPFGGTLANLLGAPELANYLWMLPISVLLLGSFNAFHRWCVREGDFSRIGKARLKQALASLVVQIGGASLGPISLLGGQVANQGIGMSSLGLRPLRMPEFRNVGLADMRQVLVRYRRFPMYSTWAALLNRSSVMLPTFFFVILFGPAVAGFYAIANRVLKAPSAIFSGAIGKVFLKTAATAHRDGTLRPLTLQTFKNLSYMSLPPLLLLAIISPDFFTIVFGEQWSKSGEFARWMTILIFFSLVASPLTTLFVVYEKQLSDLTFQCVLMLSRALALLIGARIGDSVLAVLLFSITSGLCYTGFLFWVGVQIGNGVAPMVRYSIRALLIACVVSAPIILANLLEFPPAWRIAAVFVSTMLCCFHLVRLARQVK